MTESKEGFPRKSGRPRTKRRHGICWRPCRTNDCRKVDQGSLGGGRYSQLFAESSILCRVHFFASTPSPPPRLLLVFYCLSFVLMLQCIYTIIVGIIKLIRGKKYSNGNTGIMDRATKYSYCLGNLLNTAFNNK